jgi:hypothetical protein
VVVRANGVRKPSVKGPRYVKVELLIDVMGKLLTTVVVRQAEGNGSDSVVCAAYSNNRKYFMLARLG